MWWICQNMGDIMGFNIECFSPKISEHHDQLWHLGMAVFSDISNVQRFTRNQWRRRILAATLPCFARKSTMISLIGALTISHFKLTQHCTSNLPQSSQHVKCNADCWSGCFTESHSLTSCCLPRTASIWNNYRIFTLRGSVLLAR